MYVLKSRLRSTDGSGIFRDKTDVGFGFLFNQAWSGVEVSCVKVCLCVYACTLADLESLSNIQVIWV